MQTDHALNGVEMERGESRLRVLRIVTRLNVGGPARQILALEPALARRGVESLLLAGVCDDSEADLGELLDYSPVTRVRSLQREPSVRGDTRSLGTLTLAIRRFRPHVVHTHMAKAGALGRVAASVNRVPIRVHTYHGHTLDGYFTRGTRSRVVLAERCLANVSSALVAVSRHVADDLLEAGIGQPRQFRVLSPGLDLTPFAPTVRGGQELRSSLNIPLDALVLGFVARLVPVKAVDLMLRAARRTLEQVPNAYLVIAGDGPERKLVLASMQDASPASARIRSMGWVEDMASFYSAVDVVILTSKNEGTPISLIEAGAAGLPVAATRVGGVPEIVSNEETGLLVPSGDATGLTDAILRLLRSPELRAQLGSEARRRSTQFSCERLADQTIALYRELMGSSHRV